jgi:CheY-like chemotaxis protein
LADGARALRILVADDNPDMRATMKLMLEAGGYEVQLAADGRQALEAQRRAPADVLITDLFMPERDGFETIDRFKQDYPDVKIVAMSGGGSLRMKHDYLATAESLGVHAILRKPFDPELLLETLRRL